MHRFVTTSPLASRPRSSSGSYRCSSAFGRSSIESSARPGGARKPGMERVLLLYPLHGWWSRTVRVLFYGLVAGTGVFIVYAIEYAQAHRTWIPYLLAIACVLVGYCIGLCAWVVSVDPPSETSGPGRASTWLLLYPFRTRRGMAVRAAFYVVLVLAALIFFGVVSDVISGAASATVGLGILVAVGFAAVVLQKWAVVTESAANCPKSRTTLEKILLIYGFESRTASILRGLYYVAVLTFAVRSLDIAEALDPAMASDVPGDLLNAGFALLASTALWTCAVLLNRRRITAPSGREQFDAPMSTAVAASPVPTVEAPDLRKLSEDRS